MSQNITPIKRLRNGCFLLKLDFPYLEGDSSEPRRQPQLWLSSESSTVANGEFIATRELWAQWSLADRRAAVAGAKTTLAGRLAAALA